MPEFDEGSLALVPCHEVRVLSVSLFSQQLRAPHSRNCHFKLRTSRTTNSQEKSVLSPKCCLQSGRKEA